MNKFISALVIFVISSNLYSQKIGEWNTLFSYEGDISTIVQTKEKVFTLTEGKLFSYDPEDESLETYSKINGENISNISYNKKQDCVLIIRENGDIDILYPSNNRYVNIPDLKNVVENLDKTVNDIYMYENLAYLSTNFGLLVLNLERADVVENVMVRYPFYAACIYGENLYVVTSNGTKMIDSNKNIQDISAWTSVSLQGKYSEYNSFSDTEIRQLLVFDDFLVFAVPGKGVYKYDENVVTTGPGVASFQALSKNGSEMIIWGSNNFASIYDLKTGTNNKYFSISSPKYIIQDNEKSNLYWAALGSSKGLVSLKTNTETSQSEIQKKGIKPSGPPSNYADFLSYENDRLLFAGGRAYSNNYWYPMRFGEFSGNSWFNYDQTEVQNAAGKGIYDVVGMRYDPTDPTHAFVCSWSAGLLEFKDRKLVKVYDENNSPLLPAYNNVVRVVGARFDNDGNLWFFNTRKEEPMKVIKKGTSSVISLPYPALTGQITQSKTVLIDRNNIKWITTYAGTPYLCVIDDKGTIDNIADDDIRLTIVFYNQDGEVAEIGAFFDLVEDQTGNLWVGTDNGVFIIYNNRQIFDKDIVLNKIKVPRNDGTNLADVLLEGGSIRTIVVDGGNRKWLGTSTGVYVVSANGQETINHFTMENSLLPSNSVLSMSMDHETGIIYIGTEKGLVSYKGEAVQGAESYSNVYAYPNPVEPNYQGPVTITGLKVNSTVKITDVKGNLINEGKSLGGQYIWDGRNTKRERVDTGIYLVFGSSEDGNDGVVTKIMVITD